MVGHSSNVVTDSLFDVFFGKKVFGYVFRVFLEKFKNVKDGGLTVFDIF